MSGVHELALLVAAGLLDLSPDTPAKALAAGLAALPRARFAAR